MSRIRTYEVSKIETDMLQHIPICPDVAIFLWYHTKICCTRWIRTTEVSFWKQCLYQASHLSRYNIFLWYCANVAYSPNLITMLFRYPCHKGLCLYYAVSIIEFFLSSGVFSHHSSYSSCKS